MQHASRWFVCVVLSIGVPKVAAQVEIEAERRSALEALLTGLREHAAWCHKETLFRDRDATLVQLLRFVPDDPAARKQLKYTKQKDGTWKQDPSWREPKNLDPTHKVAAAERHQAVVAAYCVRLAALLENDALHLDAKTKAAMIDDLVFVDPAHPLARKLRDEVSEGGNWILAETSRAKQRRKQIEVWAKEAGAAAPKPEESPLEDTDRAWGLKWSSAVATADLRVLGTGDRPEAVRVARACEAASSLFDQVFDEVTTFKYGAGILLLANEGEKQRIVEKMDMTAEERAATLSYSSFWVPKTALVCVWDPTPEQRLDGAVRQIVARFLIDEFGIQGSTGWAFEGIGLHLTWLVIGTRLHWFSGRSEYGRKDDNFQNRLTDAVDWLPEARKLLASKKKPDFRTLLSRHVNDMTAEDTLMSYALARYLMEGAPHLARPLLRNFGTAGVKADEAVLDATGLDIPAFEARFYRWVNEMK